MKMQLADSGPVLQITFPRGGILPQQAMDLVFDEQGIRKLLGRYTGINHMPMKVVDTDIYDGRVYSNQFSKVYIVEYKEGVSPDGQGESPDGGSDS